MFASVYIYAGLRVWMIWASHLFSFNMSFLLRRVQDVTAISKPQSPTSVSHFGENDSLHLERSKQNYNIIFLRAIIKAISGFIRS